MTGEEIKSIIQFNAPFLFSAVLAWIAYKYAIRQMKYTGKQEYYKKVRKATSNLLVLWKDLNHIHIILNEDSKESQILVESNLLPKYLELDDQKIEFLEESFNESVELIQELDIVLYSRIEDVFDRFHKVIDDIFSPLVFDPDLDYKRIIEIALPIIEELDKELVSDIRELAKRLPSKEQKGVDEYITKLQAKLQDQKVEIPKFLLKIINKQFKFKEELTKDEIITFFSNESIKWLMVKIGSTGFYEQLFGEGLKSTFKFFAMKDSDKEVLFSHQFSDENLEEFLRKFKISIEEELIHLRNNHTFYLMIMEFVRKANGTVPFSTKRLLVKLDTVEISLKKEIEKIRVEEQTKLKE